MRCAGCGQTFYTLAEFRRHQGRSADLGEGGSSAVIPARETLYRSPPRRSSPNPELATAEDWLVERDRTIPPWMRAGYAHHPAPVDGPARGGLLQNILEGRPYERAEEETVWSGGARRRHRRRRRNTERVMRRYFESMQILIADLQRQLDEESEGE